MNFRHSRIVLPAVLAMMGILFFSYILDEFLAPSSKNWFGGKDIQVIDTHTEAENDRFWVRENTTSFVLRAGADDNSALKIKFLSAGLYKFQLKPHMFSVACDDDKFQLSVDSNDGTTSAIHASARKGANLKLKLNDGDVLTFTLLKDDRPECGRGLLVLSRYEAFKTIGIISIIGIVIAFTFSMVALGRAYMLPVGYALIYAGILTESLYYTSGLPMSGIMFSTSITVALLLIFMLLLHFVKERHVGLRIVVAVVGIVALMVLFLPILIELGYYLQFDIKMNRAAWYAIYQTNPAEATEYVKNAFGREVPFFVGLLVLVWLLSRNTSAPGSRAGLQLVLATTFVLLTTIAAPVSSATYGALLSSYQDYKQEINEYIRQRNLRLENRELAAATKDQQGETYIVVIGESLNKNHMGLWGYIRQTTPLLYKKRDELLLHQNSFSNHTHTMAVLKLALTSANQANLKDYLRSPSLIEVVENAGFETYWFSSQAERGANETPLSVLTEEASHVEFIDGPDHALIPLVREVINEPSDKNRLIFIHLMGSHVYYCSRFPEDFDFYNKDYSLQSSYTGDPLDAILIDMINCYDNTIRYNDHVVSEIINTVDNNPSQPAGLMYFADHGEDVYGFKNHDSNQFTYYMAEIPLLFWFSESYRNRYPDKVKLLESNLLIPFTNDYIYDTALGMFGVETNHYSASGDLTSKDYKENLVILHGRKTIDFDELEELHNKNDAIKQNP